MESTASATARHRDTGAQRNVHIYPTPFDDTFSNDARRFGLQSTENHADVLENSRETSGNVLETSA